MNLFLVLKCFFFRLQTQLVNFVCFAGGIKLSSAVKQNWKASILFFRTTLYLNKKHWENDYTEKDYLGSGKKKKN